jgi:hypothetical protein
MALEELTFYERDRPIGEAAAAIEATAEKAKEMLEQIQASKIWALLTARKPPNV